MAEENPPAEPPGRRREHKMRTQRALQQAALELFAKHGYDDTTTEEIAEQAGVSPRTFFRYFPTKESVLFVGEYGLLQSMTKQFLDQPDSLSDLEALRDTFLSVAPRFATGRRSFLLYERAIASSVTLRGRVQEHIQQDVQTLATAVAQRRCLDEPDEGCGLLAAIMLVTYRRALTRWREGPANGNLSKVIANEFDLLTGLLTPARAGSAP